MFRPGPGIKGYLKNVFANLVKKYSNNIVHAWRLWVLINNFFILKSKKNGRPHFEIFFVIIIV